MALRFSGSVDRTRKDGIDALKRGSGLLLPRIRVRISFVLLYATPSNPSATLKSRRMKPRLHRGQAIGQRPKLIPTKWHLCQCEAFGCKDAVAIHPETQKTMPGSFLAAQEFYSHQAAEKSRRELLSSMGSVFSAEVRFLTQENYILLIFSRTRL